MHIYRSHNNTKAFAICLSQKIEEKCNELSFLGQCVSALHGNTFGQSPASEVDVSEVTKCVFTDLSEATLGKEEHMTQH